MRLGTIPAHRFSLARSAGAHRPSFSLEDIYVIAAQWMAALAVRLCSFFGCGSLNARRRVISAQTLGMEQGDLKRPTFRDALGDYILAHASSTRPILRDHAHAHERDPDVCAAIAVLLCARHPAAVLRCVVSVIVGAVKAVADWARPNISTEIPEADTFRRFTPALANLDAASAIPVEVRRRGEIAPPQHVLVQVVKLLVESRRFAHVV